MILQFHLRGLALNAPQRGRFAESLGQLEELISISAGAAVLEHGGGHAPPFRVFVSLAVPGPDIHAEARDHTLQAAWLKVVADLNGQIQRRKAGRQERKKTKNSLRSFAISQTRPRTLAGSHA